MLPTIPPAPSETGRGASAAPGKLSSTRNFILGLTLTTLALASSHAGAATIISPSLIGASEADYPIDDTIQPTHVEYSLNVQAGTNLEFFGSGVITGSDLGPGTLSLYTQRIGTDYSNNGVNVRGNMIYNSVTGVFRVTTINNTAGNDSIDVSNTTPGMIQGFSLYAGDWKPDNQSAAFTGAFSLNDVVGNVTIAGPISSIPEPDSTALIPPATGLLLSLRRRSKPRG